jgi:LAO/AO transport system kinase
VFIRSLATRGALGGLSRAAGDVVTVLDAMGFDPILVETVGVGQDELDVAAAADAVVWVTVPGLGDEVQALKAGALEIADLFVVNKADREGADRAVRDLATMLELRSGGRADAEILETVATTGAVALLWAAVERHRARLGARGDAGLRARRRQQALARVRALVLDRVRRRVDRALAEELAPLVDEVLARVRDPREAADRVVAALVRS